MLGVSAPSVKLCSTLSQCRKEMGGLRGGVEGEKQWNGKSSGVVSVDLESECGNVAL